jgi:predicted phosphodiesterase
MLYFGIMKPMITSWWSKLKKNIGTRRQLLGVTSMLLLLYTAATVYINTAYLASQTRTLSRNDQSELPPPVTITALPSSSNSARLKSRGSTAVSSTSGNTSSSATGGGSGSSAASQDTGGTTTETASAYVAYYADSQSDTDEEDARHQKIVDKILASSANPIFHGGDLMEDGTQNSLDRFNNIAGGMVSSRYFYSALGNNDRVVGDPTTPSPLFLNNFSFPNNERWYSVNTGNLHMVVLDSAFCSSCSSQLSWLASDLQSSDSQSRITGVIFHHPTFASTIDSYLVDNGVDFVIDGHTHTYAKTSSNGIYYFTLPGGGSLGYALASIYSDRAQLTVYNENGATIDSQSFNER